MQPIKNLMENLRMQAEIIGVPARKQNPMKPTEAMTAAEAKRQRKMAKRAKEVANA